MSDLKCPFCGQELIIPKDDSCFGKPRCVCRNPKCEFDGWHFPVRLVSELICTRKALDVAKEALNDIQFTDDGNRIVDIRSFAHHAIEQITALEQKDK